MGNYKDKMTQSEQSGLEDIARKEPAIPLRNVITLDLGNLGNEISGLLAGEGYIHVGKTSSENLALRLSHSFHDVVIADQHQLMANEGQLVGIIRETSPQTEIVSIGSYDNRTVAALRGMGVGYFEEDPIRDQRFLAQIGNAIERVNSIRDGKTGLYTGSVFEARLNDLISSYSRTSSNDVDLKRKGDAQAGKYLGVIYLDIDNFKLFNDNYQGGHHQGDEVIAAVADAIKKAVRNSDLVGRVGGDEYAIAFEADNKDQVRWYAERIKKNVEEIRLKGIIKATGTKELLRISASVGYIAVPTNEINQDAKGFLGLADTEMYKQKPHK